MVFLRSLLFNLIQWTSVLPASLLSILAWPLPPKARLSFIALWARFVMGLARWVLGIRYRVEGLEHLLPGPCVILSKHQSAWETIAFQAIFPPVVFVLKKELLRLPFFGWGLAMTFPIAINRDAGREALRVIEAEGRDRLAKGLWVVIFPEGTRTPHGQRKKYQAGGAMLAVKAGVPILPVAHNAGRLWGKSAFTKYPGEITVAIGPPIETAGRKAGEVNAAAEAWIEARMEGL
ncbi:MAG TPA: lysophospholipid acyltransferase family protein [Thiobacillaceae bacterium]|nr:lysophospholipid acyltransferase family protein [Thiobacillaceae bacterium]